MKKLPIGIQDLRKLRAEDFIYIDKTPQIYELIKDGGYYFLSRPRRFGKSLLVSTIAELFKGNKALFNDLWISNHWDWNKTNPTIEFRFNNAAYREVGLKQYLSDRIKEQAKRYAISLSTKSYPDQLKELIETLAEQYGQVVFLVDEYDKPIIDYLDDVPKAEEHRDILKIFYSVLKPLDIHLRFVFLTGVSKFSRMSIFSELNNLNDITMHPKYATMLGYTQKELLAYFAEHITKITTKYESREALLDQIQLWYNGYTWDGKNKVYNPFSTLSFFDSGVFRSFWFETGTPTFLIKLLQDRHMINLEEMETDATTLESFDLHKISTETLLFQTGYITIKKINPFGLYELGYPNQEVRESMLRHLILAFTGGHQGSAATPALRMARAIHSDHVDEFCENLNSLLAAPPYELHQNDEPYYHSIAYLALALIGVHIQTEIHTSKGRIDAVIETETSTYVIEFKTNQTATIALHQIENKGYLTPYLQNGKSLYALAINFNTKEKKVDDWIVESIH